MAGPFHLAPAAAGAAAGVIVAVLHRRGLGVARRWSVATAARDIALGAGLAVLAAACVVAVAFVEAFGPSRLPVGLVSTWRNLGAALLGSVAIGFHLALAKTRWLTDRGDRSVRTIAVDLAVTAAAAAALGFGTALASGVDRRLAPALLCLPLLGSAFVWSDRLRAPSWPVAIGAVATGAVYGALFGLV